MADKILKNDDNANESGETNELEKIKTPKKVKVKVIANIKYGEAIHNIGEKIYISASEVKEFEAKNLVEKIVIEKDKNDSSEAGE